MTEQTVERERRIASVLKSTVFGRRRVNRGVRRLRRRGQESQTMKKSRVLIVAILLGVVLVGGTYLVLTRTAGQLPPIPSRGGASSVSLSVSNVPVYLQNDPQWGSDTIGGSNETMAAAGCTVTCTAMALTAIGYRIDPQRLNADLKQREGFTPQGYLIWGTVSEVTAGQAQVAFPLLTHEAIEEELAENRPVIAKIMLSERVPHWVLIIGKQGDEFLVLDPLNPAKQPIALSSRAKSIHAIRAIRSSSV